MKIVFICGSIEPGKDGVGDYTRRLCAQLIKNQIKVGILSYNDKFITQHTEEFQEADGVQVSCYRLPKQYKANTRCQLALTWVNKKNPDWLSLQFVPYAFQNKGLPFGLARQLFKIGNGRLWHIMCHELWIGMSYESPKKEVVVGLIQRTIIKQLITKLAPKILHTQTQLYKLYLKQLGFQAKLLPLFSNIAVNKDNLINLDIELPDNYAVVFGGIHHFAPVEDFVNELKSIPKAKNYALVTIGRNGSELALWNKAWKEAGFNVLNLGEQDTIVISRVLAKATLGISTTPMALVEKSGALAAKQSHGLPVICLSRPWHPRGIFNDWKVYGILDYKKGELNSHFDAFVKEVKTDNSVVTTSNLFLKSLKTTR